MIDCIQANYLFYLALLIAFVSSYLPFTAKVVNPLNTMIHETGHAIVSLIFSGKVDSIQLNADTSGSAKTKSKYWIGKVLTSAIGYPTSSITALALFYTIHINEIVWIYYFLFIVALLNLVLWVRNAFGIIWLVIFVVVVFCTYYFGSDLLKLFVACFFSSIILLQSFSTTLVLLVISIKQSGKAGDAKNLQEFMFLPAVFWALLFVVFAVIIGYKSVMFFPCLQCIIHNFA